MLNENAMIFLKKDIEQMSDFFLEPKSLGERLKFKLQFSDYVTKAELKNVSGFDTSKVAKKVNLGDK